MIFKLKSVNQNRGEAAEIAARQHLEQQGLRFICANYTAKTGEIDLIMQDQSSLVFIEVRYRGSSHFGGAISTIDHKKQMRIQKTAQHYLVTNNLFEKCPVRFDVVAMSSSETQWIKGAF